MTAYNIVRFRVKPGRDQEFIAINKQLGQNQMQGFQGGALIKTGDRSYYFVGEWDKFDSIVKARPLMIANLDQMRPMLENLGEGLGVTEPASGEAVAEF